MTTIERPIRFDRRLWEELDERSGRSGEDVSRLVNAAVERFLEVNRWGEVASPGQGGGREWAVALQRR